MQCQQLDYDLPADRIAIDPAEPRDAARLMVVERDGGRIAHRRVRSLGGFGGPLRRGDLLIFNQTRVLPAHFCGRRAATGGSVTGLYIESPSANDPSQWKVMLESGGKLAAGESIILSERGERLGLIERLSDGQWRAQLHSPDGTIDLLNRIGRPPLPPYIRRARRQRRQAEFRCDDAERYNTVFGDEAGSVAAPTASLHFTHDLLDAIDRLGVQRALLTLHVGLGTFAPIRTDRLEEHIMHREWFCVPEATLSALREARRCGGRIIPVGTTCVRALESLPDLLPTVSYTARTNLFIIPAESGRGGHRFRFADGLMTNFHLPRSTLLALVAALPGVGIERLKRWYHQAIEHGYRFYSYGDAMLLI